MTKAEMRKEIERAMAVFGGEIRRCEVVGGKELLSRYTANYRAGSGKSRLGKSGSGKYSMSESNAKRRVWA